MSNQAKTKNEHQKRRAHRTRARISGTPERPRLTVHRSLRHISAQIIDDTKGVTLASASDKSVEGTPMERATAVGKALAKKAKDAGISAVVFDRGGYRYHGRVAALADGAREEGLSF